MIQSSPPPSLEQAEALSDENDLVDSDELWKLAYANLKDAMHEVITSLQQKTTESIQYFASYVFLWPIVSL